ncbi:hypothetical protein C4J81_03670 [Deltaproteobacteria bacterium Smac51]|nr:hypothetical protein C4J81_03670 [Deltaproteobacteria bacterium Smac51]
MSVFLGCIADDFTGATDLGDTLSRNGMSVAQLIGLPSDDILEKTAGFADAVIISLKIRSEARETAVRESLAALDCLRKIGCRQFFWKYCSTFDSTAEGNIGPVADALMEALDAQYDVVCPAFPENGRTVYQGRLFVGDRLLEESSMRHHPLTPMRDSNLVRLMDAQSRRKSALIPFEAVDSGPEAIAGRMSALAAEGFGHMVCDALNDRHLRSIARASVSLPLLTGGSGVARGLAADFAAINGRGEGKGLGLTAPKGPALVLAGSCSAATGGQVARFAADNPFFKLEPLKLDRGAGHLNAAMTFLKESLSRGQTPLIASTAGPEEVAGIQNQLSRERAGKIVEEAMAILAAEAAASGVARFVVAGGETSGAVVSALGVRGLRFGPSVETGVPLTEAIADKPLWLVLKSGNFGGADFFSRALGAGLA